MRSPRTLKVLVGVVLIGLVGVSGVLAQNVGNKANGPEAKVEYKPGEVLVGLKAGQGQQDIQALHAQVGATVLRTYALIDVQLVKLPAKMSVEAAIQAYEKDPRVAFAEPNYRLHAVSVPNDPEYSNQWAWPVIQAPQAWDVTTGSPTVVVANIDTGVDYTHQDLAPNVWQNPGEIPGNDLDDDGNGFIDDVYGIDMVNGDSDPMDDNGHGTHTSGTIGAVGNNGLNGAGVNWQVKIMALKFLDAWGGGWTSDAVMCFVYATIMKRKFGVNVVATNNSWDGGGYSEALYRAMKAGGQAGILHCCAAGNSASDNDLWPQYPASYDLASIISVSASDPNDNPAWFTCWGATSVDLAAPGVSILSTVPGNGTDSWDGTSMATPHVTGAVALYKALNPGKSAQQVKQAILNAAQRLPQWQGKVLTGARLNLWNMFNPLPVVTGTVPGDGEANAARDRIDLFFSQAMNRSTVPSAFSLSPAVAGRWTWVDSYHAVFTPNAPLAWDTVYQCTVTDAAQSSTGLELDGNRNGIDEDPDDYSWTFKTRKPPAPTTQLVSPRDEEHIGGLYTLQAKAQAHPDATITGVNFARWDPTLTTRLFSDDMESGEDGWTHYAFWGVDEWEWGNPTAGPGAAHSGTNCWGTNLDGPYGVDNYFTLESPDIDLGPEPTVLTFWHWYDIEPDHDWGEVWIFHDGVWDLLTWYDGTSGDWVQETIDLSAYSGVVRFSFDFYSDYSVTYDGWYLDDVEVRTQGTWVPIGPGAFNPANGLWEFPWDTNPVPPGLYDLRADAVDNCGSTGQDVNTGIVIDPNNPFVDLTAPEEGARIRGTYAVQATTSPDVTKVKFEYRRGEGGKILVFESTWGDTPFATALDNLGLTYTYTTDFGEFNTLLEKGRWDLVMVNEDYWGQNQWAPLINYVASGGRAILYYWDLAGETTLAAAFGADPVGDFFWPQDVTRSIAHPIWSAPNAVPNVLGAGTDWVWDDGDELAPRAGSTELAHFASGNAALVLGNSDHTVLLGFDPTEHGTADTDGDGKDDVIESLENQIWFLGFGDWQLIGTDANGADGWKRSWNTTALPDGNYLVRATGTAGAYTGTDINEATIDNTPPVITLTRANPNPFTGSTRIYYDLSEPAKVYLAIYDGSGNLVRKLHNWVLKNPGTNSVLWNGKDAAGNVVPPGDYVCKAQAKDLASGGGNVSAWSEMTITKTS